MTRATALNVLAGLASGEKIAKLMEGVPVVILVYVRRNVSVPKGADSMKRRALWRLDRARGASEGDDACVTAVAVRLPPLYGMSKSNYACYPKYQYSRSTRDLEARMHHMIQVPTFEALLSIL